MSAVFSPHTCEALLLLGRLIRQGRAQRRWSQRELAERLGVSPPTVQKIERGEPGCHIGSVFEAAALTGVSLFRPTTADLRLVARQQAEIMTLLPQRIHPAGKDVDDDF